MSESTLVQAVADQANGEDGRREGVARCLGIAAKGFGHEAGAVFCFVWSGKGQNRKGGIITDPDEQRCCTRHIVRWTGSEEFFGGETQAMTYFQKVGLKAMAAAETNIRALLVRELFSGSGMTLVSGRGFQTYRVDSFG